MSFIKSGLYESSDDSDSSKTSPVSSDNNKSVDNSKPSHFPRSPASEVEQTTAKNKIKTKREVYKYETDWLVSSVAWSNDESDSFELAIGSFIDGYRNQIDIVNLSKDSYDEEIVHITSFDHPFPPTKLSWIPRASASARPLPRLVASSADYLRIWRIPRVGNHAKKHPSRNSNNNIVTDCDSGSIQDEEVKLECSLSYLDKQNNQAPLTSFDWNEIDLSIIVTSSVDTTCAVWDLEVGASVSSISHSGSPLRSSSSEISCRLQNQILAHDNEVYDVSFSRQGSGRDIFVTAGGDGSSRLFDLRILSTSTVLYETNDIGSPDGGQMGPALVRVACNKKDPNYVSTFSTDSKNVMLIDVRKPGKPIATLGSHSDILNCISWAPHSAHHLCSASDDKQALIWDLSNIQEPAKEPLLAYKANGQINAASWSASHPDWIAIGFDNCLELLRV